MSDTVLDSMLVKLVGDGSSYFSMMNQAQATTNSVTGVIQTQIQKVQGFGNSLVGHAQSIVSSIQFQIGALVGVTSALGAVSFGTKLAADMESARISFGVFLHDGDKAVKMLDDIQALADRTPMQNAGLQQAAKTMLQYGIAGENILPVLEMVGNATGGNNERFQRMTYGLSQIMATGKLMGQDLHQLVDAGFNPLKVIAEKTGKTLTYVTEQMHHGAISANDVMKAFQAAVESMTMVLTPASSA